MKDLPKPETYHRRNHNGPFETCWRCAKAQAICKTKIPLWSLTEAIAFVDEFNDIKGYVDPVVFYFCRWCHNRHMCTAKTTKERRQAERARRKWVMEKHKLGDNYEA